MVSLKKVRKNSIRKNQEAHVRRYFFATRFSPFFTFLFINVGFTANLVTFLFIFVGIIGGGLLFILPLESFWVSYILWRLHVILDVSDGEIARFSKKYNDNAIYWDFMGHSIIYPLYFAGIFIMAYYEMNLSLEIGIIGIIVASLLRAVTKNFQAMLYKANKKSKTKQVAKNRKKNILFYVLSFEGFLFSILIISIFNSLKNLLPFVIYFYIFVFFLIVSYKFYKLTKNGIYTSRN